MPHLRIFGKGAKVRYVPAPEKPGGAGEDRLEPLTHRAVYHRVLRKYAEAAGIDGKSFGPHALRATAATNALDRGADLAQSAGMALGTPTCRLPGGEPHVPCDLLTASHNRYADKASFVGVCRRAVVAVPPYRGKCEPGER